MDFKDDVNDKLERVLIEIEKLQKLSIKLKKPFLTID